MSIEAMKQALEKATEVMEAACIRVDELKAENESLRQAIAEAEKQEPVAWRAPNWGHSADEYVYRDFDDPVIGIDGKPSPNNEPLYTHPQPKPEWVGLTDEDVDQGLLRSDYALQTAHAWRAGVVFAMNKLKEKNNG